MSPAVQRLIAFHGTHQFGDGGTLRERQREARRLHESLTPEEQRELAATLIAGDALDESDRYTALCCLACFRPGSLGPFHRDLVERRIIYPGVLFHGAGDDVAGLLMPLLDDRQFRNHALTALAWVGTEGVAATFDRWRREPPAWGAEPNVTPETYTHEAGWELTPDGRRRDLFTPVAFPLVPVVDVVPSGPVTTGRASDDACPWCGRPLVVLMELRTVEGLPAETPLRPAAVLTCDACTAFGPVFARRGESGQPAWHQANVRPDYLPEDIGEWEAFPESPLSLAGTTRHFLQGAEWSMLPDVPFSQLGGLPTWVQYPDYPACPDCERTMTFFGQISNEDFDDQCEGIYYLFQCAACGTTGTNYQQT